MSYPGFCKDCYELFTSPSTKWYYDHKPNYAGLCRSVRQGCQMCEVLHETWVQTMCSRRKLPRKEIVRLASENKEEAFKISAADVVRGPDPLDLGPVIDEISFGCLLQGAAGASCGLHLSLVAGKVDKVGGRLVTRHVNFDLCRQWLDDCLRSHTDCPTPVEHQLPARILYVVPDNRSQACKLVMSDGMRGQYVALSHCWGDRPPVMTTIANLQDRFNGIDWDILPKTFQDAIRVVRFFGFKYLWIDSLCIVQDDRADWHRQCPEMASIYSKAALTIAVAGAKNAYEGFLNPRPSPERTHLIHFKTSDSETALIGVSPSEHRLRQFETPRVLSSRGWAFQERLLSPRVLHFGTKQAYFECGNAKACETFHGLVNGLRMDADNEKKDPLAGDLDTLLQNWYGLVQQYSICEIKFGDDKLPALAGLGRAFEKRLDDQYCAGLWRKDMIRGLSWHRTSCDGPRHTRGRFGTSEYFEPRSAIPAKSIPPSWSWASCDYAITNHRGELGVPNMTILEVDVGVNTAERFAQMSGRSLVAIAKFKNALLHVRDDGEHEEAELLDAITHKRLCRAKCDEVSMSSRLSMRSADGGFINYIICVQLWSRHEKPDKSDCIPWQALLLEPVKDEVYAGPLQSFRRVGIAMAVESRGNGPNTGNQGLRTWFDKCTKRTIRII